MNHLPVVGNLNDIMQWEPMPEDEIIQRLKELGDRDRARTPSYDLERYTPTCPACGAPAVVVSMDTTYRFEFCPECGQRLDWRVKNCETCKWWKTTNKRYDLVSECACANPKSKLYHEITVCRNECEEWEE